MELRDIQKTYHIGESEYPVPKGINLLIENSEFIALMGPSSGSKSTLLNAVVCLDRPTSGRFMLLGKDISRTSDKSSRIRREELGPIFQTFNLIGRISVPKKMLNGYDAS